MTVIFMISNDETNKTSFKLYLIFTPVIKHRHPAEFVKTRPTYMHVSENSGTPQIIHFNRVFHYKPSILRYPYFWKHPYGQWNGTTSGEQIPENRYNAVRHVSEAVEEVPITNPRGRAP